MRQREANMTALAAIGPRKQRRLDASSSAVISRRFWRVMTVTVIEYCVCI